MGKPEIVERHVLFQNENRSSYIGELLSFPKVPAKSEAAGQN